MVIVLYLNATKIDKPLYTGTEVLKTVSGGEEGWMRQFAGVDWWNRFIAVGGSLGFRFRIVF